MNDRPLGSFCPTCWPEIDRLSKKIRELENTTVPEELWECDIKVRDHYRNALKEIVEFIGSNNQFATIADMKTIALKAMRGE